MLGLIQRVSSAEVVVDSEVVGSINQGLLLFLGVEKNDTRANAEKLLSKTLNYRVFGDDKGHMNRSVLDVGGELLVVSQFTLAADTKKGTRPSFSSAAPPDLAERIYDDFVLAAAAMLPTASGSFGADMKVSLTNDGPVTFLLEA
jgi:D-tyrosyl-tRNA(Tyr) deacylase